jgi:hypothetical protein
MATTTTNFGWDIPQSTDLVKDGATAIAALGQDIDTAFIDLKGGTSGQVLAKASATDLDFSWVAQDDSNAIQNAIMDAKGDLIGATAADTPARLAVGTNGQILTADSTAATGIKWATPSSSGGMTSIASGSLSGSSLTLTSISGSYKDLRLILRDYNPSAAGDFLVRANSVTDYSNVRIWTTDTAGSSTNSASGLANDYLFVGGDSYTSGDNNNTFMIDIYDYADTTSNKLFRALNKYKKTTPIQVAVAQGAINTSSAITGFTITLSSGTFSGGTYILYGVN